MFSLVFWNLGTQREFFGLQIIIFRSLFQKGTKIPDLGLHFSENSRFSRFSRVILRFQAFSRFSRFSRKVATLIFCPYKISVVKKFGEKKFWWQISNRNLFSPKFFAFNVFKVDAIPSSSREPKSWQKQAQPSNKMSLYIVQTSNSYINLYQAYYHVCNYLSYLKPGCGLAPW